MKRLISFGILKKNCSCLDITGVRDECWHWHWKGKYPERCIPKKCPICKKLKRPIVYNGILQEE